MNLFEYEGKALLKRHGIPTPESCLLVCDDAAAPMAYPFVLKAQVMTGGRGKAGGVKVCTGEAEYRQYAKDILHMKIKGHSVHGLLAEQMMQAEREYYLSITQQGVERPTLIFSRMGGMDIESVAREQPDEICKVEIDPFTGLKDYQIKFLAGRMELDTALVRPFLRGLENAFFEEHALLTEINPLGVVNGRLVAMDAKFVIDDHARAAQQTMQELETARAALHDYQTPEKEATTITYVQLDGDVGLISDGAGTGMLTLDLLTDLGARVACFTELGGMTSEEVMYRAMELTLGNNPGLRGLMVVLIGGFNRMDNMARGMIRYVQEHDVKIPVFTRMCGTMQEEGLRLMEDAGMKTYYDLTDTVTELVHTVKEA